jgi:hypothetical protein
MLVLANSSGVPIMWVLGMDGPKQKNRKVVVTLFLISWRPMFSECVDGFINPFIQIDSLGFDMVICYAWVL